MEFLLLGEVQVRADGAGVDAGTPRQRAVLAALAVDAPRPVTIETLVDRVWDEEPPVEARNVVYSHVSRLRRMLRRAGGSAAPQIARRPSGYAFEVEPDRIDLHRFGRLAGRGTDPLCPDRERVDTLGAALRLWRGVPLAGLTGAWAERVRDTWQRRRLDAAVAWALARVRLGQPESAVTVLTELAVEYPLAEALEEALMRALHAAGRDAEAIARYATLRERLADQLGVEPGAGLRTLHQALLRGTLPPAVRTPGASRRPVTPLQLPPDVLVFAGRERELAQLEEAVAATERHGTALMIVTGTAGVGKTALAVRWAHRVRDRFPDGQLYVNLRGFDPTGTPLEPAEALRGFLDALGVPPEGVPAGLQARAGLYRSLLADRHTLVVLDNARDADQVRPLLPAAAGSAAVVTSRDQLTALVAGGARPVTLGLLDRVEAGDLLARRIGVRRMVDEPGAVDDIISCCARLPLALSIVAARAVLHPHFPLSTLAAELVGGHGGPPQARLLPFAAAGPQADPRTVFSWSYLRLTPAAAALFRMLGVHPGPDLTVPAAASLAGRPLADARTSLAELARAHLVEEHLPGRYGCHDLLRAYAAELAETVDSPADRRATAGRMLTHYAHTADAADALIDPHRDVPAGVPSVPAGVRPEPVTGNAQALAWFTAERPVLLAVLRRVAGFDAEAWHLAWAMRRFLAYQCHWQDEIEALTTALGAARRMGDSSREGFAHCYLACTQVHFGRTDLVRRHLASALDCYRNAGDSAGQARTHHVLAWTLDAAHRYSEALAHAEAELDLYRTIGHRAGQARALNAVGWFHTRLGEHHAAVAQCEEALRLQRQLGDRLSQAGTLDSLGYARHQLGQHDLAFAHYRAAAGLYRSLGHRYYEANVLTALGDACQATGDTAAARRAWQAALDNLVLLRHVDANGLRTRLAALSTVDETA
ncbi:hypothetical protein C6361_34170 [Plantactinospora sp. BC1]|uniref:AfsR/SARP family transcriptional regulator n=1 Tax=Plantactinospora sp. BC1 TaxID=2108470 RepID=UPI000D15C546|nr:BTAD domain-containing putative transcriptional regulator [Plantactinospora sp. BC1]AVT33659.1 hypothetical protein C6361_34170 [Plantactinospora sp. BC1]